MFECYSRTILFTIFYIEKGSFQNDSPFTTSYIDKVISEVTSSNWSSHSTLCISNALDQVSGHFDILLLQVHLQSFSL
jgi:hypothetical protein